MTLEDVLFDHELDEDGYCSCDEWVSLGGGDHRAHIAEHIRTQLTDDDRLTAALALHEATPGKWCPGCGDVAPCATWRVLTGGAG